jgi:3D (Asp-Asp-Asp) domain-containing protein
LHVGKVLGTTLTLFGRLTTGLIVTAIGVAVPLSSYFEMIPVSPVFAYARGGKPRYVYDATSPDAFGHLPPPDLSRARRMTLWGTHYSIPRVLPKEGGIPLLDISDWPLGPSLEQRDFCKAALQGSVEVQLASGARRLFKYEGLGEASLVDCTEYIPDHPALGRSRFRAVREAYGSYTRRMRLVAHRTIAVDPGVIPLGSVIYVPAARGVVVTLDDGSTRVHDGYFYAADTGGAIEDEHVDIFVGYGKSNPYSFAKSLWTAKFQAYVLHDEQSAAALERAHMPRFVQPKEVVAER